jgi:hypothetical protein
MHKVQFAAFSVSLSMASQPHFIAHHMYDKICSGRIPSPHTDLALPCSTKVSCTSSMLTTLHSVPLCPPPDIRFDPRVAGAIAVHLQNLEVYNWLGLRIRLGEAYCSNLQNFEVYDWLGLRIGGGAHCSTLQNFELYNRLGFLTGLRGPYPVKRATGSIRYPAPSQSYH